MNTHRRTDIAIDAHARPWPFEALKHATHQDDFWRSYLAGLWNGGHIPFSVHLAIFVEPFLSYVLDGRKTVESRFSCVRCPPYRRVQRGDVVLLKASGGPVVGLFQVGQAWCYRLDPQSWQMIRREFADALCAQDPGFWAARQKASFATLMQVERVFRFDPVPWQKRDRRGWVVLRVGEQATLFEDLMKNTVLAFVGGIASGKSTLSSGVAGALGCPRVSFGDYVRHITQLRGLDASRENWQAVGESLVRNELQQFCAAVLAEAPWKPGSALVIDGVRHVDVVGALKSLVSPSSLRLIYVDVDDANRQQRLRDRSPKEQFVNRLDQHSTEVQVGQDLRRLADLVVDGTRSPEELVREITAWAASP